MLPTPIRVVLQQTLIRGPDPVAGLRAAGIDVRTFAPGPGLDAWLVEEDRQAASDRARVIVFASWQIGRRIRRTCPWLTRGFLCDEGKLVWSRYSGLIPAEQLLNRDFILLPFGQIASRKDMIRAIYGDTVFLRPDSPLKPFTGQSLDTRHIEKELSSLRQTDHVADEELCVLDRHREVARTEWRFWMVSGRIAAMAPYSCVPDYEPRTECPEGLPDLAGDLARRLEGHDNALVADFALDLSQGRPALVELNGFSTSGLYGGADMVQLIGSLDEILVEPTSPAP